MSNNILGEIIDTLQELKRMHALNFELLDQLNVACLTLLENHINLPNKEKLASLLSKATILLEEINSSPHLTLVAMNFKTDEKKHLFRTDEEGTESSRAIAMRHLIMSPSLGSIATILHVAPPATTIPTHIDE